MRFMVIVKSSKNCEAGKAPSPELQAAIGNYTQELKDTGALVELTRLEASSAGARIKFQGPQRTVTDGPFAETKELIGGFWVIDVKSKQEAIEWGKRVPNPYGADEEFEIEIRQVVQDDSIVGRIADREAESRNEFVGTK